MEPEDKRHDRRHASDDLSPEYLAMLVLCGGEVRESDRAELPEQLKSTNATTRALDRPRRRDGD